MLFELGRGYAVHPEQARDGLLGAGREHDVARGVLSERVEDCLGRTLPPQLVGERADLPLNALGIHGQPHVIEFRGELGGGDQGGSVELLQDGAAGTFRLRRLLSVPPARSRPRRCQAG